MVLFFGTWIIVALYLGMFIQSMPRYRYTDRNKLIRYTRAFLFGLIAAPILFAIIIASFFAVLTKLIGRVLN